MGNGWWSTSEINSIFCFCLLIWWSKLVFCWCWCSELSSEFCKKSREVIWELLRGISESLGLEADYLDKALNVESEGLQIFIANLYPPCPQPELALGMPPHSDHGLLTLLIQNGITGLQVQRRNGKWVNVNAIPNSLLFNTGDHLEVRI